jgi:hypothetical protein
MIKHSWLLLIAAGAAVAACSQESPSDRINSIVLRNDPYDASVSPLGLPDTVRLGVPFVVTFVTVYRSPICWKPDGETMATNGRQVRVTPWDVYVLPPDHAGPCELLQVGLRSTTITLNTAGIDTIRVVGRVAPFSSPDDFALDSVSASVVVVP